MSNVSSEPWQTQSTTSNQKNPMKLDDPYADDD